MTRRKPKTRGRACSLVITPLGHRILRAVAAGRYVFEPTRGGGGKMRGRKLRKGR